ncbi:MAG: P-loop NTPase fold protein [Candidatus Omnitrophica bacterium]|nr:P-loop NTPase fold protein [Candidatus Omnitrophota bacterium]
MSNDDNFVIGEHIRDTGKKYSEFDTLGFDVAREKFLRIVESVMPPLTIGLYGPWGSGKTEMIKALEEDLKNSNYLTLIFDAWKYRYECNLILPLICALQRSHLSKSEGIKVSAKKVVASAALVMANQFIKNKIGIDMGEAKLALQTYEDGYKHYKKYDDNVIRVEKEYNDFIKMLLAKKKKKKVVIFIDNLDRCLPDIVVNLLEDISSFLSIKGAACIYILALDKENVIKAIHHRYPDFDGKHYLEKIVQIALKMPLPQKRENHDSSCGRYHLLKRFEWGKNYNSVSKPGDPRAILFEKLASIDNVFGGHLLGNPRRVERVVNKLIMLEVMGLFQVEKNPEDAPVLIFLLLLHEYFPKVYNALREDKDFSYLHAALQWSVDKVSNPFRKKKDRERFEPNTYIPNEVILDTYCDDDGFFNFLRGFSDLQRIAGLPGRFKQMLIHLNYIG